MMPQATLESDYVCVREAEDTGRRVSSIAELYFDEPSAFGWLDQAKRQIDAIARLPKGWDSHGADSPDPMTLNSAFRLLYDIADGIPSISKPRIDPSRSGGVHFCWEGKTRSLDLEVISPTQAKYSFEDESLGREEEGIVVAGRAIPKFSQLLRLIDAN